MADWRDEEAQANLAALQASEPAKPASWADTWNTVKKIPAGMLNVGRSMVAPAQGFGSLSPDQAAMSPETFQNPLVKGLADATGEAIKSGVTAPGRALAGEIPMWDAEGHTSPQMVQAGFDTAATGGGASVAGSAGTAARGVGRDFRILGRKIGGEQIPEQAAEAATTELGRPRVRIQSPAATLASDTAPGAAIDIAEHAPPFYSGVERAVENMPERMTGAQALGQLRNTPGIKTEEMDWRGINDFLKERADQPVTKQELENHLDSTAVQLKTVEKHQLPPDVARLTPDQYSKLEDKYRDYADQRGDRPSQAGFEDWYSANRDEFSDTKWGEYQLPGGENYRERLLTLPNNKVSEAQTALAKNDARISELRNQMRGTSGSDAIRSEIRQLQNQNDVFNKQISDNPSYKSSHFPEPDVIVHRRSTDRMMDEPLTPDQQAAVDMRNKVQPQIDDVRAQQFVVARDIRNMAKPLEQARTDKIMADVKSGAMSNGDALRALDEYSAPPELKPHQDRLQELRAQEDALLKSMPEAPTPKQIKTLHGEEFQSDWLQAIRLHDEREKLLGLPPTQDIGNGKTAGARIKEIEGKVGTQRPPDAPFKKSWHQLAMNDALREAAESGHQRISWTSGGAHPTNPKNLGSTGAEADAADKGMKGFYDKILVDYMNKIGKAHGVSVKQGEIPQGAAAPAAIHYMDIPDSLRKQILTKGFSLFDEGAAAAPISIAEHAQPSSRARDPNLWHDISKIKLPKPISEMSAIHEPVGSLAERTISPSALQGGRLLPLIGDRTATGTRLTRVNGFPFDDPVEMQGGHGFMAANANSGAAWASGKSVAQGIASKVRKAGDEGPLYGSYTAMGERSSDFSHHVSDTLAEMLKHTSPAKNAVASFDSSMKVISPGWPGVGSEGVRQYLANAPGAVRAQFAKLMDTAKYQNAGFPSVAEARFAVTDPRLLHEQTGASGLSVAQLDPSGKTFQSANPHRSYDTNLGGAYAGGLPTSVPKEVMYPDIVKPLEAYRDALPDYKPTIDYLMSRQPKGLPFTQKADQKWVDSVSKHLEGKGFRVRADTKAAAPVAAAAHTTQDWLDAAGIE